MQPTWSPTRGQIALIEVTGDAEACLTGIVVDSTAELVHIDLGASPPIPVDGTEVTVSFFQADALYLVQAWATVAHDRLINLAVREVDRVQRRATARAHVALPVCLTALDGPGDFLSVSGTTVDVGVGGCCVRTLRAFPSGEDPTVTIDLDEGHSVVVGAQVVCTEQRPDGWEYRLCFAEMDEPGAKLLADLTR